MTKDDAMDDVELAQGAPVCPICGKDGPHYHDPAEHEMPLREWLQMNLDKRRNADKFTLERKHLEEIVAALALRPAADDDQVVAELRELLELSNEPCPDLKGVMPSYSATWHFWDTRIKLVRREICEKLQRLITLAKAPVEDGWQAIETAPHMVPIMARYHPWNDAKNGLAQHVVWFCEGEWRPYPKTEDEGDIAYVVDWRPLPGPPLALTPTDRGDG